jgi:hypothetical protein
MNYMNSFKIKKIKLPAPIWIVIYLVIAGAATFLLKPELNSRPKIDLTLQAQRQELIQIFCDANTGFVEPMASNTTTTPAQQNGEAFSVPLLGTCKRIRLDLGEMGSVVKINSASLTTSRGEKLDILSRILAPSSLNEIRVSESVKNEYVATGNDPFVVLAGDFSTLTATGYSLRAMGKMLFIFVLVFVAVFLSALGITKLNQIISHHKNNTNKTGFMAVAKKMPIAAIVRIIGYLLIASIVTFYFKQDISAHPQISLSLQTHRTEGIQIFCDVGTGFIESMASNNTTAQAQQNGEVFSLPLAGVCKRIRLDLGEMGSVVKINTATLLTARGEKQDLIPRIKAPSALNEIRAIESNPTEFMATGNDPYIILSGEFSTLTELGFSLVAIFKMVALFFLVILVVAASDYWVNKADEA